MSSNAPPGWWTFAQVQEYLGHANSNSTEVWLTRHGIHAERHYRIRDVKAEREKRAGIKRLRNRLTSM